MTNSDIEKVLKEYYTAEADSFVLPKVDIVASDFENKIIVAVPKRKGIFNSKVVAALVACAVLLLGVFVGMYIRKQNNAVASVVSIDVNPSVEIKLNKNDVVVEVAALNGDGQDIIGDMVLEGTDVESALDALIRIMLENGYITEFQNSVLISVENDNNAENQDLRKKIISIISSLLENENTKCAIITQRVEKSDEEAYALAEKFGISIGKAQTILSLCSNNSNYSAEALAKLSINELTLLLENANAKINGELSGSASKKMYITALAAKNTAIEYLRTAHGLDIKNHRISFDFDNERMVYFVTFVTEDYEYYVKVGAVDGHILGFGKSEIEYLPTVDIKIKEKDIKDIISTMGIPADDLVLSVKLRHSEGEVAYVVEFVYKKLMYELEINAANGEVKVIKWESDGNTDSEVSTDHSDLPENLITEEEALEKAIYKSKLTPEDITNVGIEFEYDNGKWQYEIVLEDIHYEYKITINAENGWILDYERGWNEKYRKVALVGTTGNVYAFKMKIKPEGTGLCGFTEIYKPMEPKFGYVDGSIGDPSFNDWITKYTEEWFEENRLFVGELIADGQIEINGIYIKYIYNSTYDKEENQLLLVYNQLTEEEPVREEDGSFYGYYFLLELPKEDYPEEYFTSGFGRGMDYVPEDATKYY